MKINSSSMQAIVYAVHAITGLAVVWLTFVDSKTMIFLIIVGALIGLASMTTVEHRYSSLFVAFGLMLAPAFSLTVMFVNRQEYLELLSPILMVIGISWSLQRPGWVPLAFSAVSVALVYLSCYVTYVHRYENDYALPEQVVQDVIVCSSIVTLSLIEAGVGVAQAMTAVKPKSKKKKSRTIVTPTIE